MTRSGSTNVFFERYIVLSIPNHNPSGSARTKPIFNADLISSCTCGLACIGTISPSMSSKFSSSEMMPASCIRRTSCTVRARRSKPSAALVLLAVISPVPIVQFEARMRGRPARSERAAHLFDAITFDDVARPHVLIVLEGHAAFLAGLDFAHFVLEALERRELAFVHDDIVADETHARATLHDAVGDAAAGDIADLGNREDFQDERVAEHFLAQS